MGLAILTQGLEAFVLLAGGLGLPLLFILASGVAAAVVFHWLRFLLASDRLALLITSAAAAAVPWVTYWLFPLGEFSGIGVLVGLLLPYGGAAALCPCLVGVKRLRAGAQRGIGSDSASEVRE